MKILVLSAHPDDETIGAGGTVARFSAAGDEVHLWIATEVYEPRWPAAERETRKAEAARAAEILGVKSVRFGGYHTMTLSLVPPAEISAAVTAVVAEVEPELLLAPPPGDVNSDHSALFEAALVVARGVPGNPITAFYAYEIVTTTRFCAAPAAFQPDTYVDVTETFARKLDAMRAYASELRPYPHPRSVEGLEIAARERGLACGAPLAEAFMLVARRDGPGRTPLL